MVGAWANLRAAVADMRPVLASTRFAWVALDLAWATLPRAACRGVWSVAAITPAA